jgi:SIR2-like domain
MQELIESHVSQDHFDIVVQAMAEGMVVPLLGAGVNLCGRPPGAGWEYGRYLPSGAELADILAGHFRFPEGELADLVRVSQYADLTRGWGPLYEKLHHLFDADYPPSAIHELLASLPGRLRLGGTGRRHQLIVTTNYDDALERAFEAAGEPFDLVCYLAVSENRGKFLHVPPDGEPRLIERPNEYHHLSLEERTVILKIHGAIDRRRPERDSYVITEDHYIEYLTRTDVSTFVPVMLAEQLSSSHFLFLGYSMRDWNLRVILHRIWADNPNRYRSWATQAAPRPLDEQFWRQRSVEVQYITLEAYAEGLDAAVERFSREGGSP